MVEFFHALFEYLVFLNHFLNFAGSKAPGTGNGSNPVATLYRANDNKDKDIRLLGSLYAEVDLFYGLMFKSNYGMDYNNNLN